MNIHFNRKSITALKFSLHQTSSKTINDSKTYMVLQLQFIVYSILGKSLALYWSWQIWCNHQCISIFLMLVLNSALWIKIDIHSWILTVTLTWTQKSALCYFWMLLPVIFLVFILLNPMWSCVLWPSTKGNIRNIMLLWFEQVSIKDPYSKHLVPKWC